MARSASDYLEGEVSDARPMTQRCPCGGEITIDLAIIDADETPKIREFALSELQSWKNWHACCIDRPAMWRAK
jgi:hypothetical protein